MPQAIEAETKELLWCQLTKWKYWCFMISLQRLMFTSYFYEKMQETILTFLV